MASIQLWASTKSFLKLGGITIVRHEISIPHPQIHIVGQMHRRKQWVELVWYNSGLNSLRLIQGVRSLSFV